MKVNEFYEQLNRECTRILEKSLLETNIQASAHDLSSTLQIWYQILEREQSSSMLLNAIEEIDVSCLQMLQGIYRGSFASLRLSLEMLCAAVYFSAHSLEYIEWSKGNRDIIWSSLSCPDNGILSRRFTDAYYPDLKDTAASMHTRLKELYRALSEMVHGNNNTWDYSNPSLSYSENNRSNYRIYIDTFTIIANYILSLRYLNFLADPDISRLEAHINDSLGYIEEIRIKLGGQKNE